MTADAESKPPKTDFPLNMIHTLEDNIRQLEADLARKAEEVARLTAEGDEYARRGNEWKVRYESAEQQVASLRRERDEAVQLYDEAMALMEPAREASEKALAVLADNAWLQRELQDAREGATRVEAECQKVMRSLELVRDNLRADKEAAEQDAAALREYGEAKAAVQAEMAEKGRQGILWRNEQCAAWSRYVAIENRADDIAAARQAPQEGKHG